MHQSVALVVEDDVFIALEIETLLIAEGFSTILALTRDDAFEVAADRLSIAVVNLKLADEVAGQAIIRALRSHVPNLPVVVVTGFPHTAPEADLRGLGGPTNRLRRPVDPSAFVDDAWDVIARAEAGLNTAGGRRKTDPQSLSD